jgi:tetratricopeptide (TPR) repeat protein
MSSKNVIVAVLFVVAPGLAVCNPAGYAQTSPAGQSSSSQPKAQADQSKSGNTLAVPPAPADTEELAAAKAYEALPLTDLPKKIAAGEEFLKKYPDSPYRSAIYSSLTLEYVQAGNSQKAFEVGDKEVALRPDDVQTLALLSQTLPRAMSAGTPEPEKVLAKAEGYAKRAIEVTPTIQKPEGMTDQSFAVAKNTALAWAHSGLGLVYFRRSKFADAIPELEQSLKIDPNPSPDPVNLFLLGAANQRTSHFDDAALAFNKCAAINSGLQSACRSGADESKKQASTQLSAPK